MIWNQQEFDTRLVEGIYTVRDVAAGIPGAQIVPAAFMPPSDARIGNELIYWGRSA